MLDALGSPADIASWAATAAPGADVVGPLAVIDPSTVDGAAQIDLLIALERQIAWLAAAQKQVLAALDGRALDWAGAQSIDYTQEQVGAVLRLAPGTAAHRLEVARALVDRLPTTLELLARGEISYLHARTLADAVTELDTATTTKVEDRVLPRAGQQTVGQFRASVRRAVIAVDPRQADQRHQDAIEHRQVVITPVEDGMAQLWALLPADGALVIRTVLDSLATVKTPGETRTMDQRRADCLVDVFARVLADPALPELHGHRPAINVTIAASTLLGCDDRPAELDDYGPITAHVARRIAADETGTWRRILTDPNTGHVLDYARKTYRPPANLTDHVIARDRTCIFPGCQRPARTCELDHGDAWCAGGNTSEHNVHPLCTRHHHAKHNAGWTVQRTPDGTYHWTAPTGHTVHPPDDG